MTNEEFETLVRKLESKSEQNPGFYRFKVLLFTGLGYGYILFFLALFLFLLTISVLYLVEGNFTFGSLKALMITGALSYFVGKALIVKMDMPKGYYLKENEAPELEKTIKELSRKLKTPKIHSIVLDDDFNASVAQISKFGLFGPKQNILLIGIPLISSLTREQFTSVLAHELAHISHSDTELSSIIYRVRMTWAQLMTSLEQNEQFGTFLFRKFLKWYYPRYSAYTFVMARQEEYAADAAAARVTSPEAVRDTLCAMSVSSPYYFRNYMGDLFEECSKTNELPKPYSSFFNKAQELDQSIAVDFFTEELERKSNVTDTHPCLLDRLKAIGMEPVIPKYQESAIEYFFANPNSIFQFFNQVWLENNEERWNEQQDSFQEAKQRLVELENSEVLDLHGHYEKAILTRDLVGSEPASALLETIIDQYPAERIAPAYLALGDIYLRKEATAHRGEELIRKSMELNWECKEEALNTLCEYFYFTGQLEAFEETRAKLEAWEMILKQFEEESRIINEDDHFVPHDKSAEELATAIEVIRSHSEIVGAYLVRKEIEVIPERNVYVLGLKVHIPDDMDQEEYINQLVEKYSNELYTFDDTYFNILNGFEELEEGIKSVAGSFVFSQTDHPKKLVTPGV